MSPEGQRGRPAHGVRMLQVLVGDERGRAGIAPGLAHWLTRVAPAEARGIVSIAVVSDACIRQLNSFYLGRDHPTDVLSFPAGRPPQQKTRGTRDDGAWLTSAPPVVRSFLGDIVIARGVARRQARAEGHSERMELRVLALHGLLHLLGYDHERDHGRMSRIEQRLRRKGGLREGLIERARSKPRPTARPGANVRAGRPGLPGVGPREHVKRTSEARP
jgi:probable rRNA maturation factor